MIQQKDIKGIVHRASKSVNKPTNAATPREEMPTVAAVFDEPVEAALAKMKMAC
jgi:hypothetical protein